MVATVGTLARAGQQAHERHEAGCDGKHTYHGDYTIEKHFPDFYENGAHPPQGLWEEHWKCANCPAWGIYVFHEPAPNRAGRPKKDDLQARRARGLGINPSRRERDADALDFKDEPPARGYSKGLAAGAWAQLMGDAERLEAEMAAADEATVGADVHKGIV